MRPSVHGWTNNLIALGPYDGRGWIDRSAATVLRFGESILPWARGSSSCPYHRIVPPETGFASRDRPQVPSPAALRNKIRFAPFAKIGDMASSCRCFAPIFAPS